jgi:hypothetical protein
MIKVNLMTRCHCSHCKRDFVVYQPYSGLYLCESHLGRDIHAKARRTIRKNMFVQKGDHIGIFFRPDAVSVTLLDILTGVCRHRKDMQVSIFMPVNGHRDAVFKPYATYVARTNNYSIIPSESMYSEEDEAPGDTDYLEKLAEAYGCSKVAVPDTLDVVAPSIFDVFFGLESAKKRNCLCPGHTGRIMTPLMGIRTEEARIYGHYLVGKEVFSPEPMNLPGSPGLSGFQERHPSTYYALLRIWEEGHDCFANIKALEQGLNPGPQCISRQTTDAGNGGIPPA